jgi:hypothetical protein
MENLPERSGSKLRPGDYNAVDSDVYQTQKDLDEFVTMLEQAKAEEKTPGIPDKG